MYTGWIFGPKGWFSSLVGGSDWDGTRFHHSVQNGEQFKMYELFIFGIFHVIFQARGYMTPQKVKLQIRRSYCIEKCHLHMPKVSMFLQSQSLQSALQTFNQCAQTICSGFYYISILHSAMHLSLLVLCLSSILLSPYTSATVTFFQSLKSTSFLFYWLFTQAGLSLPLPQMAGPITAFRSQLTCKLPQDTFPNYSVLRRSHGNSPPLHSVLLLCGTHNLHLHISCLLTSPITTL